MTDTLYGLDISNHQNFPPVYQGMAEYQAAQFIVVQAIPRPTTTDQFRATKADGKHCGAYLWLWFDPTWRLGDQTVEDDMRRRLATIPDDVALDMRLWLDVEDNQSTGWASVTVEQRVDDVNRALAVLDDWSYARGLPEAGIYWSVYFINLLFGGMDYFNRKQWRAHYSMPAGSLIGGNTVAHQYTSTPVDQNVMLASEIVTAQPAPEDPCAGLAQALAYVGDDLPPRIEAAMKGQTTTAKKREVLAVAAELRRVREQFLGAKT